MKSTGIIIQARTQSTRLPNKILLPFYYGISILDILLTRLYNGFEGIPIIVATSTNINDDKIEELIKGKFPNIRLFRGNEDVVLKRFIDAAEENSIQNIVRICSDNVFIDVELLKKMLLLEQSEQIDYVSYYLNNNIPVIKSHQGFWAEMVTLKALKKVDGLTNEKLYHEHVTNYIYTHTNVFKIKLIKAPDYLFDEDKVRFTIDTIEDYRNAQTIYKDLIASKTEINAKNILNILDRFPEIKNSMLKQIKLNSK